MRLIKKIAPATFLAIRGKDAVHLNFQPFISHFALQGNFVLLHWNKIFRQYGYYVGDKDTYLTHPAHLTKISLHGELGEIFPDEPLLPTACIIFRNAVVQTEEDTMSIKVA